jgi:hypothetical protein
MPVTLQCAKSSSEFFEYPAAGPRLRGQAGGVLAERPSDEVFEPDVMLPAQYFTLLRKRSPQGPEYLLVIAMLQDAIDCFQKYRFATDENGVALFADAYEWIKSDDRRWPFSFENVCGVLNLDSDYLRRGLATWGEARGAAARQGGAHQERHTTVRRSRDATGGGGARQLRSTRFAPALRGADGAA